MITKTKKVLLLIDQLSSGGAERQITNLAIGLKSYGYDVRLCRFYEGDIFYENDLAINNIQVETILDAKSALKRPFTLASLIKKWKPTAVIAYKDGTAMGACLARLLTAFNLIVSERNTTQFLSTKEKIKFFLYRFANHIVPNSYSQTQFIQSNFHYLKKKTTVITNTIDIHRFHQIETNRDKDTLVISTTARVMPQKNVLNFLEAVKIIKDRFPAIKFRWFGSQDDNYFAQVKTKITELGLDDTITFEQPVRDVEKVYQQSDIYCLPSIYEGFPNVVCEAMACGLPIACSNVCDNPKIVEDGINGYLFDPSSPVDIANKLQNIINLSFDQRSEIGKYNTEKIQKLCSPEVFIAKYIDLIN